MKHNKHNLLPALLLVAMMAIGTSAWAQDFTIEASHNTSTHVTTFTITRTGDNLPAQTINFRTVNRSAYAGEHYVARVGTRTFTANQTTDTVKVKEKVANNVDVIYRYQNSTTRTYRFEVLDVNGFELAHNDRDITYSNTYKYTGSYLNKSVTDLLYFSNGSITSGSGNNYLDVAYDPSSNSSHVMSNGYIMIDDGYDYDDHTLCNISTSSLYSNHSGLRDYLNAVGCKMYATVYFTMYEEDDGYQYIQILADNSTTYDGKDGDGKISNGPTISLYKAAFILTKTENHCTADHYQAFPHRYDCHDRTACGQTASHTEFEYADSYLYEQKYQSSSYNANNNGALVLNTTVNTINVRFDANGSGDDTWYLKNLKARLALVDATNPTIVTNVPNNPTASITVSAGPYIKGNTFYVSVPFKEIVTVTGTPTLSNNWGTLSYTSGSGSNVLTFSGTITNNIGSTLMVSGLSGTVKDLAGNSFTWPSNTTKTFSSAVSSQTYTLAATNTEFAGLDGDYWVSDNNHLPQPHPSTVYFYKGIVNNTNQVTLVETTDYTLAWSNNTQAGTGTVTVNGAGSYTGSVSTTFPIRWSNYTVSFHSNGSIGIPVTGTMSNQSFQYGVAQSLTANAFSRTGFTFTGWNTQPDGSGTAYSDGQSVTGLNPEDGGTVDLYAQWSVIPWTGSGDNANDPYLILYASQLDLLATNVNGGNDYGGKFFQLGADITYGYTTNWYDAISTENNYTAIGGYYGNPFRSFGGVFDGDNHTISGIRIYKGGSSNDDNQQGLFGRTYDGTVKNVTLADARITGYRQVGGIIGNRNYGQVVNCHVTNTVAINAVVNNSALHGGIVGYNSTNDSSEKILNCTSAATISIADGLTDCNTYGGIAGKNQKGKIENCLVVGANVSGNSNVGAIVGEDVDGTFTANYYRGCTVNGTANAINVGTGSGDIAGARSVHQINLDTNITASGESVVIDNVTYYAHLSTITLGYTGTVNAGYYVNYQYNDGTVHAVVGNTFEMPGANITVSSTFIDVWGIAGGANGSSSNPYIISDTTGLNVLAQCVNGTHGYTANDFYNKHFKLGNNIEYTHTTAWDNASSTENNYTAIGKGSRSFRGTFDGDGKTISGIRIYTTNDYQGLFGGVYNCTVKNLNLSDARIKGNKDVAGVAGYANNSTISNCRVADNVAIRSDNYYCGGIVGNQVYGTVSGCISEATISGYSSSYGGIVGRIMGDNTYVGTVKDCLFTGTIPNGNQRGGIAGNNDGGTLSNNYYTTGDLGGVNGSDQDGARRARAVTLGENLALVGDSTVYDVSGLTAIGTGNHVLSHNDGTTTTLYSGATQTVSFTYTGTVPEGYLLTVRYNDGSDHILTPTENVYSFTMPAANVSVSATLVPDYATWWNADADHDGTTEERAYIITTTTGLNLLAREVNGGNDFDGKFFKLGNNITYSHNTDWNDASSTENNFTTIGTNVYDEGHGYYYRSFSGTFNGCGYTVSGIRIYKGGTTNADNYQGLFGRVSGGTIKNLTLTDAVITGRENVGGIAGYISMNNVLGGIIDNCHVSDSVTLHAVADNASYHGGIVGHVNGGTVSGCTSAATLSYASGLTDCAVYGGIVGLIGGDMQNCLVLGANVSGTNYVGAVVGTKNENHTYAANYYRGCTVNGTVGATNVGIGSEVFNTPPKDIDGVRSLHTLTLGNGISTTNASETKVIGDVTYYASASTVTLSTTVPTGYAFDGFSATGGTLSGSTNPCTLTFTPAANVIVSATFVPDYATWWNATDVIDGTTEARAYIITTTTGLNLLASEVNGGTPFNGKFFKLGNDIEYSYEGLGENESNYTAIGTIVNIEGNGWYFGYFNGTFDGCGHTVSGIRIYKDGNTDGDDFQGLFGQTGTSATIKNVNLSDARITGRGTIGGIVGYIVGNLQNCRVLGTNISGTSFVGAIVGYNSDASLSRNYYNGCTVNVGSTTYTSGIGCGSPAGDITENDGAMEGYALSLGEHITATTATGLTYSGSGYCAVGATLTLNAEGYTLSGGYIVKDAQNNDVPLTDGNTFTMPASNVTVSATLTVIDYITGHAGTEDDPYIIMYRSQLDLLAERENSGTN